MAWRIDVTSPVRPQLNAMDHSLRMEVVEHAQRISQDPVPVLRRRALSAAYPETLVYEYESEIVRALRMELYFDFFPAERRLALVGIRDCSSQADGPT